MWRTTARRAPLLAAAAAAGETAAAMPAHLPAAATARALLQLPCFTTPTCFPRCCHTCTSSTPLPSLRGSCAKPSPCAAGSSRSPRRRCSAASQLVQGAPPLRRRRVRAAPLTPPKSLPLRLRHRSLVRQQVWLEAAPLPRLLQIAAQAAPRLVAALFCACTLLPPWGPWLCARTTLPPPWRAQLQQRRPRVSPQGGIFGPMLAAFRGQRA